MVASPAIGNDALMAVLVPEEPEKPPTLRDAVPLTATVLLSDPDVRGAKVMVNVVLWPAARVTGSASPLIVKAELLMEAWETVTRVPPEFFRVAVFAMLCPTATVPNESEVGLTCMFPAVTAVPRSAIRTNPLKPVLLMMERLADGLPAACGVKVTVMVALCPDARTSGVAGPLTT